MELLTLSDIANPKKTKETLNIIVTEHNQLRTEHGEALKEVNEKLLVLGEMQTEITGALDRVVPKRLTEIPTLTENADSTQAMVYVDYNAESYKTPVSELGTQVKTVGEYEYKNIRVGGYIFLEKGE